MNKISAFLRKIIDRSSKSNRGRAAHKSSYSPLVIPREQHNISRKNISANTCKVLYRLHNAKYSGYLVGGGVRDLLLGLEPKDFDVVTDAKPEQIRKLFRNCRLIGKRFRLAHIYFKSEIVEVATFRANEESGNKKQRTTIHGLLHRDNIYGSIDDDVWRRDFTINALYYNIADFSLIDYAGGLQDLSNGIVRIIGDPETRFTEDPVRMLRAVRFAAKLGMTIEDETAAAIPKCWQLLHHVSSARLFDETMKLFLSGYGAEVFAKMRQHSLFQSLFPLTDECLNDPTIHRANRKQINRQWR